MACFFVSESLFSFLIKASVILDRAHLHQARPLLNLISSAKLSFSKRPRSQLPTMRSKEHAIQPTPLPCLFLLPAPHPAPSASCRVYRFLLDYYLLSENVGTQNSCLHCATAQQSSLRSSASEDLGPPRSTLQHRGQ